MAIGATSENLNSGFLLPFRIRGVTFKNRILRSSIGGRTANWDGKVTEVWKNFEKRFALGGVGGVISTTMNVDGNRQTPLQYPSIANNSYIPRLKKYISEIRETGCRYIIQIGDPGYATQTSLFPEHADSISSSSGFDLIYGYNNFRNSAERVHRYSSSTDPVEKIINSFTDAAKRAQDTGADGLEITAAKGYLIHQFLNPGINRRSDKWGGNVEKRFALLQEIISRVRSVIGDSDNFILGLRLSARDLSPYPDWAWMFRFPWSRAGNTIEVNLGYARQIAGKLDFLHIVSGYGFPSPHITTGKFPTEEVNIFFNHTSHLSIKAWLRAELFNLLSRPWGIRHIAELILQSGWSYKEGNNLEYAGIFKRDSELTLVNRDLVIIANGGFQDYESVSNAIRGGDCDMISLARSLIANPDLINRYWLKNRNPAGRHRCSFCNRCVGRTSTSPLGCYDINRFEGANKTERLRAMLKQLNDWNCQDKLVGE